MGPHRDDILPPMPGGWVSRTLMIAGGWLLVNSAYLAAFASPTIFYYANVALHVVLGAMVFGLGGRWLLEHWREIRRRGTARRGAARRRQRARAHPGGHRRDTRATLAAADAHRSHHCGRAAGADSRLPRAGARGRRQVHAGPRRDRPGARRRRGVVHLDRPARPRHGGGLRPDRKPARAAGADGRRGRRRAQPLLSFLRRHQRRPDDPRQFLPDEQDVRALPQGHLRAVELVGASLLVVQQPVVPQIDRVHAGRRRNAAIEVVRRLPRSRRLLQRPVRSADQGADRHAGSAGRPRVHVVPFDLARPQHDGPGRFRDRVPAAAPSRRERQLVPPSGARPLDRARPRAAQADVPQAVPPRADVGILLVVPQGPPRRPGQRLPLVPRLQRLRQLAGVGRVG